MNIEFAEVGRVTVARVLDTSVDASGAADLKERVGGRIDGGARRVVVELSRVSFMDSSGLGALLALRKRMAGDGEIVLAGCRPGVVQLLRLTRLDRVFDLAAGEAEGVAALGGSG